VVSYQLRLGHAIAGSRQGGVCGRYSRQEPSYKSITLDDRTISVVGNNAIARAAVDLDAGGKALFLELGVMTV
jgi:hypothetical protein